MTACSQHGRETAATSPGTYRVDFRRPLVVTVPQPWTPGRTSGLIGPSRVNPKAPKLQVAKLLEQTGAIKELIRHVQSLGLGQEANNELMCSQPSYGISSELPAGQSQKLQKCYGNGPSSSSSKQAQEPNPDGSSHRSGKVHKGNAGRSNLPGSQDAEDNEEQPSPDVSSFVQSTEQPTRGLMCPYFVHSPERFRNPKCAKSGGWRNVSRLK